MKNTLFAAVFAIGFLVPGTVLADNNSKSKANKTALDLMTTQSVSEQALKTCSDVGGIALKNQRCSTASQYPENALAGMNLNY